MVAVHEPRRGQATAPVDAHHTLTKVLLGRGTRADGDDAPALDGEVAGGVFAAAGV
jgi:hypothetical protein